MLESTYERWQRKGLLRPLGDGNVAVASQSEGRLRQAWNRIADFMLAQLQALQAELDCRRGTKKPNRWRLRRLYRWQQHHPHQGPRETYDELIPSSAERSCDVRR